MLLEGQNPVIESRVETVWTGQGFGVEAVPVAQVLPRAVPCMLAEPPAPPPKRLVPPPKPSYRRSIRGCSIHPPPLLPCPIPSDVHPLPPVPTFRLSPTVTLNPHRTRPKVQSLYNLERSPTRTQILPRDWRHLAERFRQRHVIGDKFPPPPPSY